MTKQLNQRSEERIVAALPVKLGDVIGLTRDVSVSGICFEVDADFKTGSEISFVLVMETPSRNMNLNCQGHIVRTEMQCGKTSIAVRIIESVLEAA